MSVANTKEANITTAAIAGKSKHIVTFSSNSMTGTGKPITAEM
jgi:hypothetical protein